MADKSLSVIGGTYGVDGSGIVEDSGSEYGRGGGGIEDDDADERPAGVVLLLDRKSVV